MRALILIVVFAALLAGCKRNNAFEKETVIIDSTKVVLQVKLNELRRTSKNIEVIGLSKFETYNAFLRSNIKDTIARYEATAIQQFLNSGITILRFEKSKEELIRQTEISIAQLQKLSLDVREGKLPINTIRAYYCTEKSHAEELISIIEQNITAFNLSVNNYKNSVIKTEEYIKKINSGILPSVIPDSNID